MPTLDLSELILNVIKSVFKDFKFGCFIVSSIFTGIVDFPVHLQILSRREFLTTNCLPQNYKYYYSIFLTFDTFFSFGTMFLAGERCDIGTLLWVRDTLKLNPVDHYWQTGN